MLLKSCIKQSDTVYKLFHFSFHILFSSRKTVWIPQLRSVCVNVQSSVREFPLGESHSLSSWLHCCNIGVWIIGHRMTQKGCDVISQVTESARKREGGRENSSLFILLWRLGGGELRHALCVRAVSCGEKESRWEMMERRKSYSVVSLLHCCVGYGLPNESAFRAQGNIMMVMHLNMSWNVCTFTTEC